MYFLQDRQTVQLYFTKVIIINHIILSCMYFNLGHTAKWHFKLYGDSISLLPLKLGYSRRASHQISTHVLHILLEEVLGYEDVVLVPGDSGFSLSDSLLKLTGCKNYRYATMYVMYIVIARVRKLQGKLSFCL